VPRRSASRSEFERQIADLALTFGWRHYHTHCAGRTRDGYAHGFPRDVLLRDGRLAFIAVRRTGGTLALPETRWARELAEISTVEMHILEAGDLRSLMGVVQPQPDGAGSLTRLPQLDPRAPPRTAACG